MKERISRGTEGEQESEGLCMCVCMHTCNPVEDCMLVSICLRVHRVEGS